VVEIVCVTVPRFVVPGQTYLITRRCSERRFFLTPDERTLGTFLYCLAEAAQRFDVRVIVWLTMSNHYHAVVEDPRGVLPAFLCQLHKMTARALNAKLGRWENFWSAEPTCAARLVQRGDVLDKSVYALANPVVDHLVQHALAWPGASAFAALDGREIRLMRPKGSIFREDGPMPAEVILRAEVPTGWRGGREDWAAAVRRGVADAERAAMAERQATGRRVVGARAVRAASPWARPTTVEPRRNLRPHIACRNTERRLLELSALVAFRQAYAEARDAFVRGLEYVFPSGTYKMVRELGCRGAPAPA
jgi:putative transposase